MNAPSSSCIVCLKSTDEKRVEGKCKKCLRVCYCSASCKKKDKKRHRELCPQFRKLSLHLMLDQESDYVKSQPAFKKWIDYLNAYRPLFEFNGFILVVSLTEEVEPPMTPGSRVLMLTEKHPKEIQSMLKQDVEVNYFVGVYMASDNMIMKRPIWNPRVQLQTETSLIDNDVIKEFWQGNCALACDPLDGTSLRVVDTD